MKTASTTPAWHSMDEAQVLELLSTSPSGLSQLAANQRRESYGPNILPQRARASFAVILLRQFLSPLIYLLLGAAVLALAIGENRDALFIVAVLVLNAAIGAIQESRSERSAAALSRFVEGRVRCKREGRYSELAAKDLVPGDIVQLESGEKVPADIRLLSAQGISVDQASLTGESLPSGKDAQAQLGPDVPTADRTTMLHAGTIVLAGRCEGVVVATGRDSAVGHIAGALAEKTGAKPPLVKRLEVLTQRLSILAVGGVLLFAGLETLRGQDFQAVILTAVALAVSAIPEGLPVAVTVTLSIARARMAKLNVIVRSLPAVEGLGACTVIASDKTGTLTANRLQVLQLVTPDGKPQPLQNLQQGEGSLLALLECAVLCSEARLEVTAEGKETHSGDSVDLAFLLAAKSARLDWQALQQREGRQMLIPYEPHLRLAAAMQSHADGRATLYAKGAPETLFELAGKAHLHEESEALARQGYRIIAIGRRDLAELPEDFDALGLLQGLEIVGLAALQDPVREQVPGAIAACQDGGITVVMVTGDHPATALAIARELGIADRADQVISGQELKGLSEPSELDLRVAKARVFARVEPLQKLEIVESLQRSGHFVAVTGDGVNDAPALKAANLGVAMGKKGTDVARETADLILTDDNFASIVAGIEQGRIAYSNVRKVVLLLLATGLAEIVLFVATLLAGLPLPLFATQLLWLNLVTNGVQDVALGFEPGEPGLLRQKPRRPSEPILDRKMRTLIILYGAAMGFLAAGYFALLLAWGVAEEEARSAVLLLLVVLENISSFACRSETRSLARIRFWSNPFLLGSIVVALALQGLAFNLSWLAEPLRLAPVAWGNLWPIGFGVLAYLALTEAVKWRLRSHSSGWTGGRAGL